MYIPKAKTALVGAIRALNDAQIDAMTANDKAAFSKAVRAIQLVEQAYSKVTEIEGLLVEQAYSKVIKTEGLTK